MLVLGSRSIRPESKSIASSAGPSATQVMSTQDIVSAS
jgi:hypothetical protein